MKNTTSLKQELEKDAINAFAEFATEYPKSALSLMLGLLVALVEDVAEGQGSDPNQEIVIEGGERQQGTTIHAVKEALEIKIGDKVHPKTTAGLWLEDVPVDGEHSQQRKSVCVFKGVGTIIEAHKVMIDYNKWNREAAEEGIKLGIAGLVPYTSYLIRCESGEGWAGHGAIIKV